VFPHRLNFFNFPQSGNLKEIACRGKHPPNPLCAQNPQNALTGFLVFPLTFLHEQPQKQDGRLCKIFSSTHYRKEITMPNRERKNELKIYLSDDEQYILEQKVKASGMKSKSAFLRRQILYGFVYDIDYSELREYNVALGKIGGNLNQIAKRMNATGNVYAADVKEVRELMKKVWDTQKAMLSKQPYMKQ